MEALSAWIQTVPVLEWLRPQFMKNALIAVLLVSPLFGMLGTMVVNRRMAFFSDALGHSALTGVAIGALMGLGNPLWAMVGFSVLFSVLFLLLKRYSRVPAESAIGVISSAAVALGIVLLSRFGGFNRFSSYLIGDLLSVAPSELVLLAAVFAAVLAVWIVFYNSFLLVSVDEPLAKSRGVSVQVFEGIFTLLTALVVTVSIPWIGILVINALLVLPAAASRNLSGNVRSYQALSVGIAVLSGVAGLIVSYYAGTATGATIVLVNAAFFSVSFGIRIFRK